MLRIGTLQQLVQLQRLGRTARAAACSGPGPPHKSGDQVQRLDQRQVPPQLGALPEDHADLARVVHPLAVRVAPQHAHLPAGGHQDAGQHLDRGRLTRAVHADVPDHLARLDLQVDAVHRQFVHELRVVQGLDRPAQTGYLARGAVYFRQVFSLYYCHNASNSTCLAFRHRFAWRFGYG